MLFIYHPPFYENERKYIYDVIFREFLGVDYRTVVEDRQNVCIQSEYDNKKNLFISDELFATLQSKWLTIFSLPVQPLSIWHIEQKEITELVVQEKMPIIYGNKLESNTYLSCDEHAIKLSIDIFGSAFFMLTRYEEVVKGERDQHNRFPASASLAFQEDFLERPIINEYVEILWWALKKLWPGLQRKQRDFRIIPTHDVDSPFGILFLSPYDLVRTLAGDIIKRKSIKTFIRRTTSAYQVRTGNVLADENYTFDLIMDISEKHNLISCFYMMEAQSLSEMDGNYPIDHPYVINLMKTIHSRGHEMGLHPSYVSYKDGQEVKRETERLHSIYQDSGIKQLQMGGRQHFLRWQCPDTWQHYEDAGLTYDTSVSYADHIGFRCGVCYEYSVFNLRTRHALKLKERPLIVMECSAIDNQYMNLSHIEALQRIIRLKNICRKYYGDFIILWHNNRFVDEKEVELYKKIVRA
ncbi:polysaccharide deacetylase family protein [Pelosinus propionicus]|uniref:DUF7033 domain-containing protein n=1 Tax=Pelosinus propionicus DSM 13327 TaxID=1123291 RepID=A0A1I4MPK7_9FIRM|nr:polysaccharide deacetylase family protein [Pelosinus propionicus]SFM05040.1 hypothetical protein SAMN04490355_10367 [Pelosinus propionicus DSM 13327]